MSDKSFGDCPSRNIVKNPLLSTAVTGLSIEDLTHNAVLVPVATTQGLITSSEHQIGMTVTNMPRSEHEFTNFPSGDSNTNVFSPLTTLSAHPPPLDNQQPPHYDRKPEITTSTVSKASVKSEDDFDVNEYFARLQGTRYVSAPINSNPDQNANLAATEENLEEVNLNDEKNLEFQQSLTADIAQNFSQLPTVLPHVASAVFSSFTNMLNYKSREQTPDGRALGSQNQDLAQNPVSAPGFVGQNLAMDTPLMAEDVVKEVAPPPKEIPNSGSSNFRITTKKKYAQIPGLSSGTNFETSQKIELNPLTKNVKNYFVPSNDDNIFTEAAGTSAQETNIITEPAPPNTQDTYKIFNPLGDSNNQASDFQPSVFNIPTEMEEKPFEERLPPPPSSTFELHGINAPSAAIPPPPMFSTQKPGGQTGKSVLPPSVARRIGSNQPVIKPQTMQTINTDNIFVPTFDPMNYPAQPIGTSFSDVHSQSAFSAQMLVTEQPTSQGHDILATNMPSIPPPAQFTQQLPHGYAPPPLAPPTNAIAPPSRATTNLPPPRLASPPTNRMPANIAAPRIFAPTMFVPCTIPVDENVDSGNETSLLPLSNIFAPASAVAAKTISPPGPIQPPIGPTSNTGSASFFTAPPPIHDAPPFYSPIVQEQPKPGQAFAPEPPKPLLEPPKATGAVNYRMNKKKPQYYSGPIEGVGSISNSIRPVIPSVDSGTFQGALFTPAQPQTGQHVQPSMPFDLSQPTDTAPLIPQFNVANPTLNVEPTAAFDISQPAPGYPHFDITHHIQNPERNYNTAFDLSRPTTDSYEQKEEPKESKGFGIIGSLKSKLSILDINKIQHSVTTFFDPAYKDATMEESAALIAQQNAPYSNIPNESKLAETNLEIFVPNVQQNPQPYGYQQQQNVFYQNNEYYKYPNFQNQGQPFAGHCSNSHDYPTHSPHPKQYKSNKQQGYPDQSSNTTMFQHTPTNLPTQEASQNASADDKVKTEGPKTFKENQEFNAEKNMDDNVARAGPEVDRLVQSTTMIEDRFANFANEVRNPMRVPTAEVPAHRVAVAPQVTQDRTFISESFEQIAHERQEPIPEPISMFDPNTANLFAKMTIDKKKANNEFEDTGNKKCGASNTEKINEDMKTHNLFSSAKIYERKETIIPKDSLLGSLNKDDVPILGVSSVPLFGLSAILAEQSKEFIPADLITTLSDRNSSMSFFDHTQKLEDYGAKHADELSRHSSFSFFENVGTPTQEENANDKHTNMASGKSSATFFKNVDASGRQNANERTPEKQDRTLNENSSKNVGETQDEHASDLSICETCREVNVPQDEGDDQDVTNQLIENITSPIQLSNPVETTLTEPALPGPTNNEQVKMDAGQFDEISHITEETIETIQIQSATELLEDVHETKPMNYGWTESALKEDYDFNVGSNTKGYYGSKSLFFDKELKSADEVNQLGGLLAKPMKLAPSAPPAEDEEEDSKSDETGKLDVNSIEQDANKDFPIFEEYLIEPESEESEEREEERVEERVDEVEEREETVEEREEIVEEREEIVEESVEERVEEREEDREEEGEEEEDDSRSENALDSFTNRVEKYNQMDPYDSMDHHHPLFYCEIGPPHSNINMVSYFDTGNFAVDSHYRNTNTRPAPSIPPGFEEEFKRRVALAKQREEKIRNEFKTVPDTSTQTRTTSVATYCSSRIAPSCSKVQPIMPVGFNIVANITNLVDDTGEPIPELPTPPTLDTEDVEILDKLLEPTKQSIVKPEEMKLPPIPNVFDPKPDTQELPEFSSASCIKVVEETPLPELLTAFSSTTADNPATILPPFAAFTTSIPDVNPATIMPPFSAFNTLIPDANPATIVPPFAAFTTSIPDVNPATILPPFAAFTTSIPDINPATILPPFAAFTTSIPDVNPATILPPFAAFTTSIPGEHPATLMPPFIASTAEENLNTILPPYSVFPTSTPDENPALSLPPYAAFVASKPEESIEPTLPPFSPFSTSKPDEKVVKMPPISAPKTEDRAEPVLPDPINFFADTAVENPPESFSRLASYFSSPPKSDHAKSFFELSQSQNHYRHASSEQKAKIIDLMHDLTSVQNITVPKDQTIKRVNYFTVEYDTVLPEFYKRETYIDKVEFADDTDIVDIDSLLSNCRYCAKIFDTTFKVRTAVNGVNGDQGEMNKSKMEAKPETGPGSVSVHFDELDLQEQPNERVAGMNENRPATEYTPVKHHWFYRVDVEDKSIWRGFSLIDSRALEDANLNPDLNEHTLVPTDGGRYDVNITGRLRIPVYWDEKPTNVRRCSWFYKGTTDARYVPYTEPVAEKLEEEYHHGLTTAEWHRRLVLPNGEVVVMHGPSVMVHFLHSDAFSTPPQSSSRPRVVRRGHDESEIEDTEPSSIDHLLLLCHGVGSACDMRFRSVEEVVEDFRATSLQLVQSHYRNSYDQGVVSRVEVLPVSWHSTLHSGETGVDKRLAQITLESIPRLRSFTNETVLDVLFYTSPVYCQTILNTVCKELNRIYELFLKRNPSFTGGVSLGGHSLGSVILYDLLCHQADRAEDSTKTLADKKYVEGPAGTGQPFVQYPSLAFAPDAMYALGSPIAIFECIRGVDSLGKNFSLPTCRNFFNIFHPYDPIAYRIEPLINSQLRDLKPQLIPHHKGRKRMHLELKDTMARVGADLKQKLVESLKSTWNKWKAAPPTDGQLEKVVEEELEKEQLTDDCKEELAKEIELSTPDMLGRLNGGRRVDYVLQEAPLEMINEYLFAMSSHVGYWESEDTMLLMLREIYSALGVEPDSTVPQQNMTVQRTRTSKQEESIVVNATDFPSTSRGPI